MVSRKLIIDADPGVGDALAIAVALFDPDVEVLALTATAGCVDGEAATRNLEAIVTFLDPPRWPRIGASDARKPALDSELLGDAVVLRDIQGQYGLGDWPVPPVERHHRIESEKILVEFVRQFPNDVTLLTTGPLTNLLAAIELEPEFMSLLGGLVCQAGSIACGGDVTAAAELNVFLDPQAAKIVLEAAATKTLVPLDVTQQVMLSYAQFDRLPLDGNHPLPRFVKSLLPFAFRVAHDHAGQEGVALHELTAMCAVTQPHLFRQEGMIMEVETTGRIARGMTVFDRRRLPVRHQNIDVLTSVDPQGPIDYLTRVLKARTS